MRLARKATGRHAEAITALLSKPKRSKYGAVKTTVDGVVFDSKGEADRWQELRLLEKAGMITALQRQVRFPLHVNTVHVCDYVADFVYDVTTKSLTSGALVIEDFKGHRTPEYRLKKKLFEAIYPGRTITETGPRKRTRRAKRKAT